MTGAGETPRGPEEGTSAELALFRVRPARVEDAAAVAGLAKELGYDADAASMAGRLERHARRDDSAVFVAVDGGGRIAGWVHVFATDILEYGPRAEIGGLVVGAAWRARGAGRALVAAAERWAAGRGFGAMRVRSNVVRAEARRFYERLGYRVTKTQNNFHKDLPG